MLVDSWLLPRTGFRLGTINIRQEVEKGDPLRGKFNSFRTSFPQIDLEYATASYNSSRFTNTVHYSGEEGIILKPWDMCALPEALEVKNTQRS